MAIEPPKKVIKALYDYHAPPDQVIYLSFSAGDFLHVLSRENDPDWYEACNPLAKTRGLVPAKFFQTVGKTVRDSIASTHPTHDSGYVEGPTPLVRPATMSAADIRRSSKSTGRAGGGLYGVVMYDFSAERPDELEAKAGEAIIVIAQSNPEWFVAKPITRLGGPGLIPVSFIEIRDMTTNQPVADTAAAVAKAGIPRVEEWKKLAVEYKNTSIPLGSVSNSQQVQNVQQAMDRMSLSSTAPSNGHSTARQSATSYTFHQQQQQNLYAPERVSVPRYVYVDDNFFFIVECKLSNGTHWDLSRVYKDFYELQINLINAFPEEAGKGDKQRTLPFMPGPVKYVTGAICDGRRASLDSYLRNLLYLSPKITCSSIVRNFFAPREGDYEVDPNAVDLETHARPPDTRDRYSQMSQNSVVAGGYQTSSVREMSSGSSQHHYFSSQGSSTPNSYTRGSVVQSNGHDRPSLDGRTHSEIREASTAPLAQDLPAAGPVAHTTAGTSVKVKAWYDRDTCVVLKMPPRGQFTFDELYQRVAERRKIEFKDNPDAQLDVELDIEYRDEQDGDYYRLVGDEDLDIAMERNEKLTLAVRVADQS
ncbi:hypothetical protein K470DRAFT_261273 [Piedraia hortae CBS 480.64]|uniref:Protein scd2/ral3 n=1 Tax=Piedraia hortae CBS 480.64 TaxID=1314780 RepID=A0A6A7CA33_9PEZI|nr:hypothetical protein K470DRAFT_261273 [Piedraia hortae CBS 480.64]